MLQTAYIKFIIEAIVAYINMKMSSNVFKSKLYLLTIASVFIIKYVSYKWNIIIAHYIK